MGTSDLTAKMLFPLDPPPMFAVQIGAIATKSQKAVYEAPCSRVLCPKNQRMDSLGLTMLAHPMSLRSSPQRTRSGEVEWPWWPLDYPMLETHLPWRVWTPLGPLRFPPRTPAAHRYPTSLPKSTVDNSSSYTPIPLGDMHVPSGGCSLGALRAEIQP